MVKVVVCPPQPTPKHTHQMKGKAGKSYKRSCPPNKMAGDPVLTSNVKHGSHKRSKEEAESLLSAALKRI